MDKLSIFYNELINNLLEKITVDEAIHYLCAFIIKKIPSDRLVWHIVNRESKTIDILVDYIREDENNSYSKKAPFLFNDEILNSLRHPTYSNIYFCPKVASNPLVYQYMREFFGSVYNSFLCILIPYNDSLSVQNSTKVQALTIMSLNIDAYSDEEFFIFSLFQKIIEKFSVRFFPQQEIITYLMEDKGLINLSSERLLHKCKGMQEVIKNIKAVAPTKSPVLILGETGVGKELVAEAIHSLSRAKQNPLIKVNCGALAENLIDSELFGHEKGAFTGANGIHIGFFEQANGGTLFLDEIGELSLAAQIRLLRILENKELRRVGGTRIIPINVRIIAATNRNLWDMVKKGTFREDLLYRLEVFSINIPTLNERKEDIPFLTEHFYSILIHEQEPNKIPLLTVEFINTLQKLSWPGNIRQLKHTIERALIVSIAENNNFLKLADHDIQRLNKQTHTKYTIIPKRGRPSKKKISKENIISVLQKTNYRIQGEKGAAQILNIPASTLRKYMKEYQIPLPKQIDLS